MYGRPRFWKRRKFSAQSLLAGQELIFSGRMDIQGVFSEATSIPVAEVMIHSPRFGNNQEFMEKVGVVDDLPFECIIDNHFFK